MVPCDFGKSHRMNGLLNDYNASWRVRQEELIGGSLIERGLGTGAYYLELYSSEVAILERVWAQEFSF